jgi:hypothetical protein
LLCHNWQQSQSVQHCGLRPPQHVQLVHAGRCGHSAVAERRRGCRRTVPPGELYDLTLGSRALPCPVQCAAAAVVAALLLTQHYSQLITVLVQLAAKGRVLHSFCRRHWRRSSTPAASTAGRCPTAPSSCPLTRPCSRCGCWLLGLWCAPSLHWHEHLFISSEIETAIYTAVRVVSCHPVSSIIEPRRLQGRGAAVAQRFTLGAPALSATVATHLVALADAGQLPQVDSSPSLTYVYCIVHVLLFAYLPSHLAALAEVSCCPQTVAIEIRVLGPSDCEA